MLYYTILDNKHRNCTVSLETCSQEAEAEDGRDKQESEEGKYLSLSLYTYVYIYIYIERERERYYTYTYVYIYIVWIIISIYIYIYIYIYPSGIILATSWAHRESIRSAQVRAYDDRAKYWNIGIPYTGAYCPVVICPYLCTSAVASGEWRVAGGDRRVQSAEW